MKKTTDAPTTWRERDTGVVWLQVVEAARRLGFTRGRVYHLIKERQLRARRVNGLLYVREQDVRLYWLVCRERRRRA